jgi:surfactin synthase thioesterase subunit
VDAYAVMYPARLDRYSEPGLTDIADLAAGIRTAIGEWADKRPLALFGHSMGAVLAFEVTRMLEKDGATPPVRLFLSGRRAPSRPADNDVVPLDDDAIVHELKTLSGTDSRLLDEDALNLILPSLRSDYAAIQGYRPDTGARVSPPITMLTGDTDPRVSADGAQGWADHTSAEFELHTYAGGHFYLTDHVPSIGALVRERLT